MRRKRRPSPGFRTKEVRNQVENGVQRVKDPIRPQIFPDTCTSLDCTPSNIFSETSRRNFNDLNRSRADLKSDSRTRTEQLANLALEYEYLSLSRRDCRGETSA